MFLTAVTKQLDDTCSLIAAGRVAARELVDLVEGFGLKEAEFRLLWALLTGDTQRDQTQLANLLGCSPAQVSSLVERQRLQGNILGRTAPGDRRRQTWRITPQGRELLEKVVQSKSASMTLLTPKRKAA
jgi:DNA-binding MarR family transcriptional regulator